MKYDLGFHKDPNVLTLSVPDELLISLSNLTGVDQKKIRTMTLTSLRPLLFHDMVDKNSDFESYVHQYSLLLPINKRKTYLPKKPWRAWCYPTSLTAPKACPECLKSEPIDAMLLPWNLPLMLSCPIHQCLLSPCLSYQGRHVYWDRENDSLISLSTVSIMDQRTWSALTTGKVVLPNGIIHGGIWLRLLRTLLDELHIPLPSGSALYRNIFNIWDLLGVDLRCRQTRWQPYEQL